VPPATLRAWEQRYAVLRPQRSAGGLRLFSEEDELRIRSMRAHMREGLSAAEAAGAALAGEAPASSRALPVAGGAGSAGSASGASGASELDAGARLLSDALARLDRDAARQALDRLLAGFSFETVAREVLLPYLVDVGARWRGGEATIAEEHLATHVLRARMLALGGGVVTDSGPRAVLACPPGERHDIALVILSVALERRGWRITLLGTDTPIASVAQAAEVTDADCVVIAATATPRLTSVRDELQALALERTLLLAGPGSSEELAHGIGARHLAGDPVAGAAALAELRSRPGGLSRARSVRGATH